MFAPAALTVQPLALCSGLDHNLVYRPPSTLQLPGSEPAEVTRPDSPHSTSSSHSDLSSPSFNRDSEMEFVSKMQADIPTVPSKQEVPVSDITIF